VEDAKLWLKGSLDRWTDKWKWTSPSQRRWSNCVVVSTRSTRESRPPPALICVMTVHARSDQSYIRPRHQHKPESKTAISQYTRSCSWPVFTARSAELRLSKKARGNIWSRPQACRATNLNLGSSHRVALNEHCRHCCLDVNCHNCYMQIQATAQKT